MIILNQNRMPHIPRDQEWWDQYVPPWVTATVYPDDTVALAAREVGASLELARWVGERAAFSAAVVARHA